MFANLLKTDLKRAIFNWGTPVAVIVLFIMSILPFLSKLSSGMFFNGYEELFMGSSSNSVRAFFMLFCVIPYAFSYCDELNTGYRNSIMLRVGYKKYAWSKILSVAVSGAIPLMIWQLLLYAFCMLAHNPGTLSSVEFSEVVKESFTYWGNIFPTTINLLKNSNGLLFELITIGIVGLNGALWACFGLMVSSIFPNRYIVLATPFVFTTIINQLTFGSYSQIFAPVMFFELRFWLTHPTIPFEIVVLLLVTWYVFYQRGKEVLKNA